MVRCVELIADYPVPAAWLSRSSRAHSKLVQKVAALLLILLHVVSSATMVEYAADVVQSVCLQLGDR